MLRDEGRRGEPGPQNVSYDGKVHPVMAIERDVENRRVFRLKGGLTLTEMDDGILVDEPPKNEVDSLEVDITSRVSEFPDLLASSPGVLYFLGYDNVDYLRRELKNKPAVEQPVSTLLIRVRGKQGNDQMMNNIRVNPGDEYYAELSAILLRE